MSLLACGINHKTAPIEVRERVAFQPETLQKPLLQLLELPHIQEAAILSTCNRTEIYCNHSSHDTIIDWLHQYHDLPANVLRKHCYVYENDTAVKHLLRVASGLDSMVLGEPEILGQVKNAYVQANSLGALGVELNRLFQYVFSVTKKVRTETQITSHPVSIATTVVQLAKRIFADLSQKNVLLIGAGQTTRAVARHLVTAGVKHFYVANRSSANAKELAHEINGQAIALGDLIEYLPTADLIISATTSSVPILGKGAVENAIKIRKRRIMLMVDLAVPRDIEPEIAKLSDVYLYSLDDLHKIIQQNLADRKLAACVAEDIVAAQAENYMRKLSLARQAHAIKNYRLQAETLRDTELQKAIAVMQNTNLSAEDALQKLAYNLTNKLLHQPTIQFRQSILDEKTDCQE